MEILYFFEGLRSPLLDSFFSFVTAFGDETIFILLGILFFWCIDKKQGYYLLSIGFIGVVVNQFLKLWFRIPRPWVRDPEFSIVESARAGATGYSFPSGHTQSSVGVFGGIARWNKNKALRIIGIILCILVPLSRMYLGVHTPQDVLVSVVVALTLVFVLYPIIQKGFDNKRTMRLLLFVITLISLAFLIFVLLFNFPKDTDTHNLNEGIKNAYKMFGCTLGIFISYEVDRKFINFETSAPFKVQVLKFVLGIIPLFILKSGLKSVFKIIFGGAFIVDGLRYLIIVLFAGIVWPLVFKPLSKAFKK